MCFNYKVSLLTFLIGLVFSILLFLYGNPKFTMENKTSAICLIFISMIQFMDFLFWIDIKNIYGINKITTILGPILNVCQPVIFYFIKYLYYKPDIFSFKNYNLPVFILNGLYLLYFIIIYIQFLTTENLTTTTKSGHLSWPWLKYANPYFYLVLLAINIFYLFNFNYALILFSITYFFFFLSVKYFNYNAGELWCFFGSFVPLIMYFISFYVDKLLPF